MGVLWQAYSDDLRTIFENNYFQHLAKSVTENINNVVVSEDPGNSYRQDNEIAPPVPSEEQALMKPLVDKLVDTQHILSSLGPIEPHPPTSTLTSQVPSLASICNILNDVCI